MTTAIGSSPGATFSIYPPPSGTVTLSNPTLGTSSLNITATLSATDATGVTGYFLSESPNFPSLGTPGWTAVQSATNFSATVSFAVTATQLTSKTIYEWFRNATGGISPIASGSVAISGWTAGDLSETVQMLDLEISTYKQSNGVYPSACQLIDFDYANEFNISPLSGSNTYEAGNGNILLDQNTEGVITYMDGFLSRSVGNVRTATYDDLASAFGVDSSTLQNSTIILGDCSFTIYQIPSITSLSPSSATARGAAFTLTINGTNFVSGAVAKWGTTALTTSFVSATQLTAAVPASLIAAVGKATVTVTTNGGTTGGAIFTINPVPSPAPTITSLSPSTAAMGGAPFTLMIDGTNFALGATAHWGSTALTTSYVSATQLTTAVPASLIATGGTASVTVTTAGGTSAGSTFTITPPPPVISNLSPSSAEAGGAAFTLTISGTNFTSQSTA